MKRPPLSLKAQALALLAQREHSAAELRRKLLRHRRKSASTVSTGAPELLDPTRGAAGTLCASDGPDERVDADAEVDAVIDWLRAHDYLSEERFVESRIHARSARYGNLRIRQELAQHGLGLSTEAAQQLKDTELDRALEVWRRKFGTPAVDAADKARQARFLAQRGFSPEAISRVLRRRP